MSLIFFSISEFRLRAVIAPFVLLSCCCTCSLFVFNVTTNVQITFVLMSTSIFSSSSAFSCQICNKIVFKGRTVAIRTVRESWGLLCFPCSCLCSAFLSSVSCCSCRCYRYFLFLLSMLLSFCCYFCSSATHIIIVVNIAFFSCFIFPLPHFVTL